MSERMQTHHEECWRQHGHSACAERKVAKLSAEIDESRKLIRLALKECEEMDFYHSNACMNWAMLEHSQIECALCQLRDVVHSELDR